MFVRRGHRWVLAAILVLALLAPVGAAGAAPVVIDFEDLSRARTGRSFTSFTDRYAGSGVTFTSGVTAIDYGPDSVYQVNRFTTHSGVVGIEECFSQEFCSQPIDMAFRSPQHRVKLWAGSTYDPGVLGQNVVLVAFDSGGRVVARDVALLRSPYRGGGPVPVNVPLEIVLPTNSITRVRFSWEDSGRNMNGLVVDDVEFEVGAPAFAVTPDPVAFGQVQVGQAATLRVNVANTGTVRGGIKQVAVSGGDAGDFAIVSGTDGCSSATLDPGAACTLDVRFRPVARGARASTLVVQGDATAAAPLTGEGTVTPPSTTVPPTTTTAAGPSTTRPTTGSTAATTSTAPPPPIPPPPGVEVPESTPGSALSLDRPVGRIGEVVTARGGGFQPGPVTLTWRPGIGTTTTQAGPDGSFTVTVLLLPGDRSTGPRLLVATGPASTATAGFLAVPGRMQPSGGSEPALTHRR